MATPILLSSFVTEVDISQTDDFFDYIDEPEVDRVLEVKMDLNKMFENVPLAFNRTDVNDSSLGAEGNDQQYRVNVPAKVRHAVHAMWVNAKAYGVDANGDIDNNGPGWSALEGTGTGFYGLNLRDQVKRQLEELFDAGDQHNLDRDTVGSTTETQPDGNTDKVAYVNAEKVAAWCDGSLVSKDTSQTEDDTNWSSHTSANTSFLTKVFDQNQLWELLDAANDAGFYRLVKDEAYEAATSVPLELLNIAGYNDTVQWESAIQQIIDDTDNGVSEATAISPAFVSTQTGLNIVSVGELRDFFVNKSITDADVAVFNNFDWRTYRLNELAKQDSLHVQIAGVCGVTAPTDNHSRRVLNLNPNTCFAVKIIVRQKDDGSDNNQASWILRLKQTDGAYVTAAPSFGNAAGALYTYDTAPGAGESPTQVAEYIKGPDVTATEDTNYNTDTQTGSPGAADTDAN